MVELELQRTGINSDGTAIYFKDTTDWTQWNREAYKLFIQPYDERTVGPVTIDDFTVIEELQPQRIVHNDNVVAMDTYTVVHTPLQIFHNEFAVYHNDDRVIRIKGATSTDMTVNITNDGYFTTYMVAVSPTLPTTPGEYGTEDGTYLVVMNENFEYVRVTPRDLVNDVNFNDWTITRTLVTNRTSIATNEKYLEYYNLWKNNIGDRGHNTEIAVLDNEVSFLRAALNSIIYSWETDNYMTSQFVVENLEKVNWLR